MKNPLQTIILPAIKKLSVGLFIFLFALMPYGFTAIENLDFSIQKI